MSERKSILQIARDLREAVTRYDGEEGYEEREITVDIADIRRLCDVVEYGESTECRPHDEASAGRGVGVQLPAAPGSTPLPPAEYISSEEPCTTTTPGPDTDEVLRARYRFRSEPLPSLSLGELSDLLIAHAAGEVSEGALVEITGLDRLTLRAMHLKAIATSDVLWRSWRASEEARFRATLACSPPSPSDTASSSSAAGGS